VADKGKITRYSTSYISKTKYDKTALLGHLYQSDTFQKIQKIREKIEQGSPS
jgi:hypothetical protein